MTRPAPRSDAELFASTPESPEAFGEFYIRHERAVLKFLSPRASVTWFPDTASTT